MTTAPKTKPKQGKSSSCSKKLCHVVSMVKVKVRSFKNRLGIASCEKQGLLAK